MVDHYKLECLVKILDHCVKVKVSAKVQNFMINVYTHLEKEKEKRGGGGGELKSPK